MVLKYILVALLIVLLLAFGTILFLKFKPKPKPTTNNILLVVSTHPDTAVKIEVTQIILNRFEPHVKRIQLVQSKEFAHIKLHPNTILVESNEVRVDFAKSYYALEMMKLEYDGYILINDSCILTESVEPFVKLMVNDKFATESYGYTDDDKPDNAFFRGFNQKGIQKLLEQKEMKTTRISPPANLFLTIKSLYVPNNAGRFQLDQVPDDFNPEEYKNMYEDTKEIPNEFCWEHYVNTGQHEMRSYSQAHVKHINPQALVRIEQSNPSLYYTLISGAH